MKNYSQNFKAFSLIELSVVILIIGILIAGVTQGSRLIGQYKLSAANTLTQSSAVHSINGLSLWLDATDSDNLAVGTVASNSYGAQNNGDMVVSWRDVNSQTANKNTVTAAADNRRPTYIAKGINGLPSLQFDGATDYLASTQMPLATGENTYTYVLAWSTVTGSFNDTEVLIDQGTTAGVINKHSGFIFSNTLVGFWGYINDYAPILRTSFKINEPHITIFRINGLANNITIFQDSNDATTYSSNTSGGASGLNVSNQCFRIGTSCNDTNGTIYNFEGNISEVMFFDRPLKNAEIADINSYLSKKYNIKIN